MPADALLQPEWLATQEPLQPRQGRYVLGPLLGQGGMGEVREAWDVVLRRTVALKILKTMNPVSLIRFMHEAQIHARLVHPNICRLYDVESSEGAPRISLQLVRGPLGERHVELREAPGSDEEACDDPHRFLRVVAAMP